MSLTQRLRPRSCRSGGERWEGAYEYLFVRDGAGRRGGDCCTELNGPKPAAWLLPLQCAVGVVCGEASVSKNWISDFGGDVVLTVQYLARLKSQVDSSPLPVSAPSLGLPTQRESPARKRARLNAQ